MQRLCVMVTMGACLVMSAPQDVAVTVQRGAIQLNLTSSELTKLHMCLCKGDSQGCVFNAYDRNVTSSQLVVTRNNMSTEYISVYMCTLYAAYANCTRSDQSLQQRVGVQRKSNSFSLHNTDTCDVSCVDVMWDDSDTNVTIYENEANAELCSVKSLSGSQNMTHTTTIIICVVVSSIIVFIIIAVIIGICVRNKRKRGVKTSGLFTASYLGCKYPKVDISFSKVPFSSQTQHRPPLSREQEPLNCEVEKDKQEPQQEVCESIQVEDNTVYSHLHDKTESAMNPYDVGPQ